MELFSVKFAPSTSCRSFRDAVRVAHTLLYEYEYYADSEIRAVNILRARRAFPGRTSKTMTQFSAKHKGHVARLWAEAQELVSDLEAVQGDYYRAKDAYEQACIQASRYAPPRFGLLASAAL